MTISAETFAQLLTEGIHRIRIRESKPIQVIQDELGYELQRKGGASIEYWRKGHIPKLVDVERLAAQIVPRGDLERKWLEQFLQSAQHPNWRHVVEQILPISRDDHQIELPIDKPVLPSSLPLDYLPTPAPLPPQSCMPFGKNPLFVGRANDLRQLAAALHRGDTAAVSQVETAAATGLGGIGKTQLACEYAHRYGQFYPGGVFWLSFADPQSVPAQIAACGGLGAMDLAPDYTRRSLDEQAKLVLSAWQEPIRRLLVFDNCEEPALIERWRPITGGCHVLVTSRRGDWEAVLNLQMVFLGVLARSESIELFRKFQIIGDRQILDEIAEELGDLPLALHLAGSYLRCYRRVISLETYLEQIRGPALLKHPSMQGIGLSPTAHIQHVGRTFAMSYDKLDPTNDIDAIARKLLVHAAHFAPGEKIWYALLIKTLAPEAEQAEQDLLRIDQAFRRLIELGLIEAVEDDLLRMHRLVAAFVSEVAKTDVETTREIVENVVYRETARVNRAGYPIPLLSWQQHLRVVIDIAKVRQDLRSATLCRELAEHLYQISDYDDAFIYYDKALTIQQHLLGAKHSEIALTLTKLGNVLREQGKLEESLPYFEQALVIREELFGEQHPDVAASLNEIGRLLLVQREGVRAQECLARAVQIAQQALGQEDPAVADYANNLGLCLLDCLEDVPRAQYYLELALAIRLKTLGETHPLTALSYNNLGYFHKATGKLDDARKHYQTSLEIRKQTLGEEHPDTAQTLNNLGTLSQAQGNFQEAQTELEQALAIYCKSIGENHYRTAFCLHNLGLLWESQGANDHACNYYARALAAREKVYMPIHPNIALSLFHLGSLLYKTAQFSEAGNFLTRALEIQDQLWQDTPLPKAHTLYELGCVLLEQKDPEQAQRCFRRALPSYIAEFGPEHQRVKQLQSKLT